MRIPLNHQCDIPLYQQIETYLRQGILSGSLEPNTRLPAARELAGDLGVNRITIEHAYANLEDDGLIFSRVGSGTFILPPPNLPHLLPKEPGAPWPLWQQNLRELAWFSVSTVPDEYLHMSKYAPLINLSHGFGDPALFPAEDFRKTLQAVARRDGNKALEYCERNGYAPLRQTIAHVLSSQGIQSHPDNVLITSGSQQALALVSQFLLQPGDMVLVENPTYSGALALFNALHSRIVGISMDERGMQVEKLEKLLQTYHFRLIYTNPSFQNPTNTCLSGQRRRQLVSLASQYNIPVLEDDCVGDLRYEGCAQPSLKSLDPGGVVIYVSTFSKMLMPGLRVGYLVAHGPIYESLANFKQMNDIATSTLTQRAIEAYLTVGRYQSHLRYTTQVYRKRRDALLQAVHRYLPAGVNYTPPQGGLVVWLRLPDGLSADELLPIACEEGVAYAPGNKFFIDPADGKSFFRLNFAIHTPEEIEEGVRRLDKAIRRLASRPVQKATEVQSLSARRMISSQ